MKKLFVSTIILASLAISSFSFAGGDKDKEKKSCSTDKKACCAKAKSCEKKSETTDQKKAEEIPQN